MPDAATAWRALPDRGGRRYHVSDERLRAFAQLTPLERLRWVEECSAFVRLGQQAMLEQRALAMQIKPRPHSG